VNNAELIEYYTKLLIIQYHNKPRARETVATFVAINMLVDLIKQIQNGLDIENPNSNQKIIAKMLGVGDFANIMKITRMMFGYRTYSNLFAGLSGYINYQIEITDIIYNTYFGGNDYDYELSNEELRIANLFAIFRNNLSPTLESIDKFLLQHLPEVYVDETASMELTYYIPESAQQIFGILLQKNLIPKPSGVNVLFDYV
jgi:hypothetical protein